MEKSQKMPNVAKVKTPAEIQITAKELLREARKRNLELLPLYRERKVYKDDTRKSYMIISNWIKYAQWARTETDTKSKIYIRACFGR